LITVSGGELEVRHLKFLHSGGSKGPFFNISEGVFVLNSSQITLDPLIGCAIFMLSINLVIKPLCL
jgi:hypothetical protein